MQTQTMKLRELTIRYAVRKDHAGEPVIVGRSLGRPSEAASALMALLQDEPSEVFVILCLTTKDRVIASDHGRCCRRIVGRSWPEVSPRVFTRGHW